jgi:hypothetical protein
MYSFSYRLSGSDKRIESDTLSKPYYNYYLNSHEIHNDAVTKHHLHRTP